MPSLSALVVKILISLIFFHISGALVANTVTYKSQNLPVIDLHLHPGKFEDLGPVGKQFLRDTLPAFMPKFMKDWSLATVSKFQLDPYGSFIGIKSECERAQLFRCGLFAVHAPETWGVVSNESLISYLDDARNVDDEGMPYFFGLASLQVKNWDQVEKRELDQLRLSLKHPLIKGIKLAFIHNSIALDDKRYDSIYRLAAEMNVPVYHHVGTSPLRTLQDFKNSDLRELYKKSYNPALLERAIKQFPNVPFILGHAGFDFNDEGQSSIDIVLALAERYPNAYIEISALGDITHDPDGKNLLQVLALIKKRDLIEKTLYGSDGPTIPGGTQHYLEQTLSAMDTLSYSYDEAKSILYTNTAELFKLD